MLFLTQEGEFKMLYRKTLTIKTKQKQSPMEKVFVEVRWHVDMGPDVGSMYKILGLGECAHPPFFFFPLG